MFKLTFVKNKLFSSVLAAIAAGLVSLPTCPAAEAVEVSIPDAFVKAFDQNDVQTIDSLFTAIDRLLTAEVSLNSRAEDLREKALIIAVSTGRMEMVHKLLSAEANPKKKVSLSYVFKDGTRFITPKLSALTVAAEEGNRALTQRFLDFEADLNKNDLNDLLNESLKMAVIHGHQEIVRLLCNAGANLNKIDKGGATALMWTARNGDADGAKRWIDAGADVNIASKGSLPGHTALFLAAKKGHREVVQLLLHAGADVNASNCLRETPLMVAAAGGEAEIVQLLSHAGADLDAVQKPDWTPLLAAASREDLDMVKELLMLGARVPPVTKALRRLFGWEKAWQLIQQHAHIAADRNRVIRTCLKKEGLSAKQVDLVQQMSVEEKPSAQ